MHNANLIITDFLKITPYTNQDKLKLFLNCSLKLPEWTSIIYITENENIDLSGDKLKEELEVKSITVTESEKEVRNIVEDFEIHGILINQSFDDKKIKKIIDFLKENYSNIPCIKINLGEFTEEATHKIKDKVLKFIFSEKKINSKEILNILTTNLSKYYNTERLHKNVLADISNKLFELKEISERRIMKGIEPKNGKDGKLLLLVKKLDDTREVLIDSHDVANYSKLRLFDNIRKGQKVARIYKPTKGEKGFDVLENPIEAKPGNKIEVNIDDSLEIKKESNESFDIVIAKSVGYLEENNLSLKVNEELVVNGNVDLHYGHINFVGRVLVKGDVLRGFSIKANLGIEIMGNVEEAKLSAPNGEIIINKYAYGGRTSYIYAGKSFKCNISHELNVEAKSLIEIEKEAIDSNFYTQSYILIKNGTLLGGRLLSAKGVEIYTAGNDLDKKSEIYLANSIEATKEYGEILDSIDKHKKAIDLLNAHLGPLKDNPSSINSLSSQLKNTMNALKEKKDKITLSINSLLKKQKEMIAKATYPEDQRVNFINSVFSGTKIIYQDLEYEIKENLTGPKCFVYNSEEENIVESEYKPIEFKEE